MISARPLLGAPPTCLFHLTATRAMPMQQSTLSLRTSSSRRCSSVSFCVGLFDQNGRGIHTTFVDNKLIDAVSQKAGDFRQVVLLTDGTDHRPYKLPWPPMTVIFHVSSSFTIHDKKAPNSCLIRHVHAELGESPGSEEWIQRLRSAGYQGHRPSVWAVQGVDFMGTSHFQSIVESISGLAMKGSLLIGEISNTVISDLNEDAARELLEKICMSCGFRIKSSLYEDFNEDIQEKNGFDGVRIMFVAEHLRLSDDQVRNVLREMELAEETGDEETFEDW